jgi:micrococcal nuclease
MQQAGSSAILSGTCWVIDGDTIVIDKVHIRLAGIDAPELDHPYGRQSKWALVQLCRGKTVTARLKPELSFDRVVAECFLPDGRDLAAEMVRAGLALDWAKFSGGKYRHLEPADIRRKLWRAHARQKGLPTPEDLWPRPADLPRDPQPQLSLPPQPRPRAPRPLPQQSPPPVVRSPVRRPVIQLRWFIGLGLLLGLAGCAAMLGNPPPSPPVEQGQPAVTTRIPFRATFVVTAERLNVRSQPGAGAQVIDQLNRGRVVTAVDRSAGWYAVLLEGGGKGWVYGAYLAPAK